MKNPKRKFAIIIFSTLIVSILVTLNLLVKQRPEETSSLEKYSKQPGKKTFINSIGMRFVYIPPGTFMMGSPLDDPGRRNDESQHRVTLSKGFYMQTTEVTQGQWESIMGARPWSGKE